MDYEIKHQKEFRLFSTEVDGYLASAEYLTYKDYLNVTHTFVPPAIEKRGVGDALMRAVYTYALENNMRTLALCPYAAKWLEKNPEFKR